MADEEDEIPADPEFLYNLRDGFDDATFEDDLNLFPDYFDENGWPLFGEYDPYALKHPITGLVWYKSPRVLRDDETDPDYGYWFELAELFSSSRLIEHIRAKPDVPKEIPNTSNMLYEANSIKAADGNLAYLRTHVLPELREMFEHRSSSPRFALVWGEYSRILKSIAVAVPAMKRRKVGRDTIQGRQIKDAQVKWYLHWRRRHVDELGKAMNIANVEIKDLVEKIVEGKTKRPDGFDIEWFRKTQLNFEKATRKRPAFSEWGLARALKNSNRHPLKSKLLKQSLTDEPRIPSVDSNDFQ